jgi:hypothetical protein
VNHAMKWNLNEGKNELETKNFVMVDGFLKVNLSFLIAGNLVKLQLHLITI